MKATMGSRALGFGVLGFRVLGSQDKEAPPLLSMCSKIGTDRERGLAL